MEETKVFNFGMEYKMYGNKSIRVPKHFTQEQAEKYVHKHWDEIDLPNNLDYVCDSAVPDFDCSDFEE